MLQCGRSLLLAWMAATACTRWTPYVAPAGAAPNAPFRIARVTLQDGSSRTLHDVVVRQDSVVGVEATANRLRVGYPADQVRRIDRTEFSLGRTLLLAVVLPLAIIGLALLAWGLECSSGDCLTPSS